MDLYAWSLGTIIILVTACALILMPAKAWKRAALILSMVMMILGIAWTSSEFLSRPKPADLEWIRSSTKEAKVLSYRIVIDRVVYLWLLVPGIDEPRYYEIPWDRELARELERVSRGAKDQQGLLLELPFQKSWEKSDKKRVYPIPQPMLPPKLGSPPITVPRQEES